MADTITWRDIITKWHPLTHAERPPEVPSELADFLAAGGGAATVQNQFQLPVCEGGWCVFMVENQAVFKWAYLEGDSDPDPLVYVCAPPSTAWSAIGARLSGFLSAASMIEAVFRASAQLTAVGPAELADDHFLGLPVLDLPDIGWAGIQHHWYGTDDVLAFVQHGIEQGQPRSGDAWVFVGARDEIALKSVATRLAAIDGWERMD